MGRFGPFEPAPRLAVAVSGGGDSIALLLLAAGWAAANNGHVTAFTVDHGLRAESAAEAATVKGWCTRIGCGHETLAWQHDGPITSALQEQARAVRYHLLQEAAVRHGILHLLVAHHADDQAETIAMRRNHGSGPDGLAGMAAVQPLDHVRILRPLLDIPGDRLKQTCRQWDQPWIEDPSNRSMRFERVRVRQALAGSALSPGGADAGLRAGHEAARAEFLARAVTIYPTGHGVIDPSAWASASPDMAVAALGDILRCIGNQEHAPKQEALVRLASRLAQPGFSGATLGGCRLVPGEAGWSVVPEVRLGYPPPITLEPGVRMRWGGFTVMSPWPCVVAAVDRHWPHDRAKPYPANIVRYQPGFFAYGGLTAVPTLGLVIHNTGADAGFTPRRSVATGIFPIVS